MNAKKDRPSQRGFSMVELLIAMTVTLVVTGSIYAFIAQGQSAFRREPEVAERQQNIRIAMDLIMRDVTNAGSGMPPFIQTFTSGLDSNNDQGAPMGLDNQFTDELEMITNPGSRDNEPVCDEPGGSPNIRFIRRLPDPPDPAALPVPQLVLIVMSNGTWTMRNTVNTSDNNGGSGGCDGATPHTQLNFNTGLDPTNPKINVPGSLCDQANGWNMGNATSTAGTCDPAYVGFSEVVRYRIRPEPGTGIPMLQRFSTADWGQCQGQVVFSDACFQTLARGVEDLQVTYTQTDGTVGNDAPVVVANTYNSLVTRVSVTLSARSEMQKLAGQTTNVSAPERLRGRLVSSESPRSALMALSQEQGVGINTKWR